MKKVSGFTLIEVLIVVAIIATLGALVMGGLGGCSVSDGTRKGNVTKFSNKGIMMKTYEGELVMGGFNRSGGGGANVWEYSVWKNNPNRDTIVDKLNKALEEDIPVALKYKQSLIVMPWNGETTYDITNVTLLTNAAPAAAVVPAPTN